MNSKAFPHEKCAYIYVDPAYEIELDKERGIYVRIKNELIFFVRLSRETMLKIKEEMRKNLESK